MGSYYHRFDWAGIYNESPATYTEVWLTSTRQGADIKIDATVKCSFTFPNGGGKLTYDGEINFNMWSGASNKYANIKKYSDRWYASREPSRTKTCSMIITSTASNIEVGFNVTVPASDPHAMHVDNTYVTLGETPYNAPSAPTWANITPNPCSINSSPLITWGGAGAGSLGTLYYDVEVRSTQAGGGWTDWLRISSAQGGTSYSEVVLNRMNVHGVTPFPGVKYQYRIRSSDGFYATSGWINTPELSVGFGTPTPPSSIRWGSNTAKKGAEVALNWSGASGGTGSITGYELSYRWYHAATNTWDDWTGTVVVSKISTMFTMGDTMKNNDRLQARIRTQNSWGQWSNYGMSDYLTIRGNQMWIKVNGSWKEGECYVKVNGSWKEGTPWIKVNGSWKEST